MQATEPARPGNSLANVGNVGEGGTSAAINGCYDTPKSCEPMRVVRQYINPAVYVESSICSMAPFRKSPVFLNYSSDDEAIQNKVVKVKKCLCFSSPKNCPCHPCSADSTYRESARDTAATTNNSTTISNYLINNETGHNDVRNFKNHQDTSYEELNQSISATARDDMNTSVNLRGSRSKISVKQYQDELKLALESTSIFSARYADDKGKEEAFKNWCDRKDQQKKIQEQREALMREIKLKEKEIQLQQERENFKRWLSKKKREEEKKRKEIERQVELERLKQQEMSRKREENELHFRIWLKKKEQLLLEKKINEQMKIMKADQERQQRLDESVKAYRGWLSMSKNKPKPIPLNQGIQSLKSSASVTYVNPTPWIPNIEVKPKPSSQ